MLVDPIRKGRPEDRTEIAIERCPLRHRATQEGEILLSVVAYRERIVDAEPAVARTAVVLHPPTGIGVVGILVAASLEIRRERIRGVARAAGLDVGGAGLPPIGVGQPSQKVIERPVLHHHYYDMLDPK